MRCTMAFCVSMEMYSSPVTDVMASSNVTRIRASAELVLSSDDDRSHRAGPSSAVEASAMCSRPALVPSIGFLSWKNRSLPVCPI